MWLTVVQILIAFGRESRKNEFPRDRVLDGFQDNKSAWPRGSSVVFKRPVIVRQDPSHCLYTLLFDILSHCQRDLVNN